MRLLVVRSCLRPLTLAAALCVLVCVAADARAQAHCQPDARTTDAALAARFAPVLRFAPREPYYPTMSFFYAFDGLDNNGNGLIDFEDVDEIAAFAPDDAVRASWDTLDAWYVAAKTRLSPDPDSAPPVAPAAAVYYRVKDLDEAERAGIWRYLRKDLLAWNRSAESDWRRLDLEDEPFKVIEYYFYYVRDKGLVGHPQDIEFVFVFLPADPSLACHFRVVVGAGHTDRVPNNVMVVGNQSILGHADLARRDTLTNVIVELGGHSSAPDMPPYGHFRLGIDVNWQTPKSWGTRDIQAIAEMGFGGEYRPDMTVPRDSSTHALVLWPRGSAAGGGEEYALLPAPLFERLSDLLPEGSAELTAQAWASTIDSVGALLDSVATLLGGNGIVGLGSIDSTRIRRMAAWNRSMVSDPSLPEGGEISPGRMHVWEHSQYTGSTTHIFKSQLFPPSIKSVRTASDVLRLISWGYTTWPGSGHQLEAGFLIPWWSLPIPVRGFLELQAGIGSTHDIDKTEFTLGLTYISSYFQRVAWYTTVMWIPDPNVTGSHFTAAAGPSFLLWSSSKKSLLGPVNILRFSTGPRFRLSSSSTGSVGVDWEFTFSFRQ